MDKNSFPSQKIFSLVLFLILFAASACAASTPAPIEPTTMSQEQVQVQPSEAPAATKTPEPTKAPKPTNTLEPTSTPEPSSTPEPTATAVPKPMGLSRENPYPKDELVSAPNWDIQILEIKRGEAAWQDLQTAQRFNQAALEGMEYILVKIRAKTTYTDNDEHPISSCDFELTGDRLVNYNCFSALVVVPDPQLDAKLYAGGETEGWVALSVGQGEGNLILVFDEGYDYEPKNRRYIAIDDGASIVISPGLAAISPTDAGMDRNAPAPITEIVRTDDWEFVIVEAIRGEEAWKMVLEANKFNDPPKDGFEYIAVKLYVRNIGSDDNPVSMDGMYFKSTGSAGVLYDSPFMVDPEPSLSTSLYPGGESEGWVILEAAVGETEMKLVFDPLFDFSGENKRFISLEP